VFSKFWRGGDKNMELCNTTTARTYVSPRVENYNVIELKQK